MTQKNRRRISTNFLSVKIFLTICFVVLFFNFFFGDNSLLFNQNSFLGFIISTILLGGLFYFIETRKLIEFDDADNLFIVDKKNRQEIEISLASIDKILFSAIGLNLFSFSSYSYRIIYRGKNSHIKKVRLFPRTGQEDISKIIKLTKTKNPNVKICSWSYGWNELFD